MYIHTIAILYVIMSTCCKLFVPFPVVGAFDAISVNWFESGANPPGFIVNTHVNKVTRLQRSQHELHDQLFPQSTGT